MSDSPILLEGLNPHPPLTTIWKTLFVVPEKFYEALKGLQKNFWGMTKKCQNENLS